MQYSIVDHDYLCTFSHQVPFSLHGEDISSTEMAAIEETVATSDQLGKVHVVCGEKVRGNL